MEQILDLPVESQRKLNYAGFWIRFGASLIDGVILWIAQFLLTSLLALVNPGINLIVSIIFLFGNLFYFAILESSEKQATLGKMAVGIKVGNANGDRISFGNAIGRYLGKFLSTLLLLIGYLMAAWDEKKQALHDKLADTYVFEG